MKKKPKILICLRNGFVTAVATTLPECTYIVVDFDTDPASDAPIVVSRPDEQHATFEAGQAHRLFQHLLSEDLKLVAADLLKATEY